MKPISNLKYFQLSMMSKPVCQRVLYRAIKKYRVRSIVEIGMGDCSSASNMIRLAQKFSRNKSVKFTGIDLFEGRPADKPKLSLIEAHKELNKLNAKIQLVPGEPYQTIPRIANSHLSTDMVVISAGYELNSIERSWFYVPRMIHANSLIFLQDPEGFDEPYRRLNRLQIEQLADKHGLCRPIAA